MNLDALRPGSLALRCAVAARRHVHHCTRCSRAVFGHRPWRACPSLILLYSFTWVASAAAAPVRTVRTSLRWARTRIGGHP